MYETEVTNGECAGALVVAHYMYFPFGQRGLHCSRQATALPNSSFASSFKPKLEGEA